MVSQAKLIDQLDDEEKKTIFSIIDKMLTNKKFKDFFNKNVATYSLSKNSHASFSTAILFYEEVHKIYKPKRIC